MKDHVPASGKIVVYTVAVDWGSPLPPVNDEEGVDFVCFYRGERPKNAEGWELRELAMFPELDAPRFSRLPKAVPHLFLPEYRRSIYIDTSVSLKPEIKKNFARQLRKSSIALIGLSRSLDQEFTAVQVRRYDSAYTLSEQRRVYAKEFSAHMDRNIYWGGLILREHHNPLVMAFGLRWLTNILRYSRRDQLSLPIALASVPSQEISVMGGTDEISDMHSRLPGIAKDLSYQIGEPLVKPFRFAGIDREGLYIAEISSLRRLLRTIVRNKLFGSKNH